MPINHRKAQPAAPFSLSSLLGSVFIALLNRAVYLGCVFWILWRCRGGRQATAVRPALLPSARCARRLRSAALDEPETLAIIAGNGSYPVTLAQGARRAGVKRICVAAFVGETQEDLASLADDIAWLRVGQLGKLLSFVAKSGAQRAVMAGQIAPKHLFDLRPDFKALMLL